MTQSLVDNTPVLVGIGCVTQRSDDPQQLVEPIDLMIRATKKAGADCGVSAALTRVERIAVPRGRWSYRNPAAEIGRAIDAENSISVLSNVGVLQQSLIADACERIAHGEINSAVVTGADAGYRLLRSRFAGVEATERQQHNDPDVELNPAADLRHPAERAAGLEMPVGLYALLDSASRARAGRSVAEHRDHLASTYARFSEIAAQNPHAWSRETRTKTSIRDAGPDNPMQAFPYTRAHCSSWNVDQAAALLFCSAARATELGIDRARWIFPLVSAESNHMTPVSARADLSCCRGAVETSRAALKAVGMKASDIDLFELYSCFPVAVDMFAEALGVPADRDLSVTGSMAFAGGPYNNYFLQATCRAAELLRSGRGTTALLSCVSGIMTKQAVVIWCAKPARRFERLDLTDKVARDSDPIKVSENYSGVARIVGHTVLHTRDGAPRAVALLDTSEGRALASSITKSIVESFEQDDWIGRSVEVRGGEFEA